MSPKTLSRKIKELLALPSETMEITPLHEHASYRSYFRIALSDGRTLVAMVIPEGKWSISEEISNKGLTTTELPFLNVARYLRDRQFPVADIIAHSEADGLILLGDLGDRLLENEIRKKSLDEKIDLYKQAIALLAEIQNRARYDSGCIAFMRRFDDGLLMWEMNHFFEYGIEKRIHKKITDEDKRFFQETARRICTALTQQPQVFVHRDFQSRNPNLHKDRLWLLDFQDALMGPVTYDLVALLRDSYVVLDRRLKELLIDEYLGINQNQYDKTIKRDEFSRMFDWMTVQRKLKDAGRFVFIDLEKGNPDFLRFIPDTLSYVKEALLRQPELKEFYERLKTYVPEWK